MNPKYSFFVLRAAESRTIYVNRPLFHPLLNSGQSTQKSLELPVRNFNYSEYNKKAILIWLRSSMPENDCYYDDALFEKKMFSF